MPDTIVDAQKLISLASRTSALLDDERQVLFNLSRVAEDYPERVWDELELLRRKFVQRMPMYLPERDYARCISVAQYWRYCLPDSRTEEFEDAGDYASYLEHSSTPDQTAFGHLSGPTRDELFPAASSWIVPLHRVMDVTGAELPGLLRLRKPHRGPYLILVLPRDRLIQFGCRVRQPVAIDAVHRRNFQWIENAVPDERIDGPIVRGTVGGVLWKP